MVDKELNNTSAHAIGKTIKSSQQKANLVLKSIRGLPVEKTPLIFFSFQEEELLILS